MGGRKKERVGRWEEVDRARKEEREERVRQIRERYVLFLFTLIRFRRESEERKWLTLFGLGRRRLLRG